MKIVERTIWFSTKFGNNKDNKMIDLDSQKIMLYHGI